MKTAMTIFCSALILASCNAARAQGHQILSPLSSKADNSLISEIQSRNPGTLCSLAPADGHARLMSYGNEAVVDIDSVPTLLAYRPGAAGRPAEFVGKAVDVSGMIKREPVNDLSHTVSHDVTVQVKSNGRHQPLQATWTCQAALITVRTAH